MREKSLLSAIIIGATLLLLISYKRKCAEVTTVSAYDNEKESLLQEGIYYTDLSEKKVEVEETKYIVTERELVGLGVNTYASEQPKKKQVKVKKVEQKEKEPKYIFTDEEIKILERIVEAECTDKSKEAKMNVCSVIINRVESDEFPDDIESVVFQTKPSVQFSPIKDGRYDAVTVTQETKDGVKEVIYNGVTNDALFFCNQADVKNNKYKKWFNNLEYLFKDDSGHSFYR